MKRIVWVNPASFIKSLRDLMSGPFRRENANAFSRLTKILTNCIDYAKLPEIYLDKFLERWECLEVLKHPRFAAELRAEYIPISLATEQKFIWQCI